MNLEADIAGYEDNISIMIPDVRVPLDTLTKEVCNSDNQIVSSAKLVMICLLLVTYQSWSRDKTDFIGVVFEATYIEHVILTKPNE